MFQGAATYMPEKKEIETVVWIAEFNEGADTQST